MCKSYTPQHLQVELLLCKRVFDGDDAEVGENSTSVDAAVPPLRIYISPQNVLENEKRVRRTEPKKTKAES